MLVNLEKLDLKAFYFIKKTLIIKANMIHDFFQCRNNRSTW